MVGRRDAPRAREILARIARELSEENRNSRLRSVGISPMAEILVCRSRARSFVLPGALRCGIVHAAHQPPINRPVSQP
jgi:hypothetical protein